MKTSDFDYYLPPECIAQVPVEPRDSSRLLVMYRDSNTLEHKVFSQLGDYLRSGDVLVLNQTRVIPARVMAKKVTGGKVELLLLRKEDSTRWEVLVGGKKVRVGTKLLVGDTLTAVVQDDLGASRRKVIFNQPVEPFLAQSGQMPLPPYIHTKLQDPERYQTVYSTIEGSAAAPTAGLHFTPALLASLSRHGIQIARVTLHVGLDTFAPVTEENAEEHIIHTEWCEMTAENASIINMAARQGGRVIAVGTTSVRTLETAAQSAAEGERVGCHIGPTSLFIMPGYQFKAVDGMITNFHLPKSTLLMLVSAFAGRDNILAAYKTAVESGYRFYSFGDAMLIL
ncbi:MAG: tRNA preQ1(34) S-adenosylmethionine ribosyltransferase-isomerase QueA [Anaerolineaceae bacterium]